MLGAFAEAGLMSSAQPGLYAYIEALCYRDVCNPSTWLMLILTIAGRWCFEIRFASRVFDRGRAGRLGMAERKICSTSDRKALRRYQTFVCAVGLRLHPKHTICTKDGEGFGRSSPTKVQLPLLPTSSGSIL